MTAGDFLASVLGGLRLDVGELVKALPDMSTREIAKVAGVNQSTVVRNRADAFASPDEPPARVVGADGKSYPGRVVREVTAEIIEQVGVSQSTVRNDLSTTTHNEPEPEHGDEADVSTTTHDEPKEREAPGTRRHSHHYDKHRASLHAREPRALAIQRALDQLGIPLVRRQRAKSGASLTAITAIYRLYDRAGGGKPDGEALVCYVGQTTLPGALDHLAATGLP
jgi:hypothetical protein